LGGGQMTVTKREDQFKDIALKWIQLLQLEHWHIELDFCESHEFISIENSTTAVAFCHTNWTYMTATIRVNSNHLEEEKEERLPFIALHELMHCVLNEMREDGIDHEERVATMLANSFLNTEKTLCVK
jgi:predicted SprT family Zn-dependent metalloprotease